MPKFEYQKSIREGCLHAGFRNYFFDVKKTKANDYFLVITESKKSLSNNTVLKHKIFIYKEHLEGFQSLLADSISFIKGDKLIR
jgi:hypothetical protein